MKQVIDRVIDERLFQSGDDNINHTIQLSQFFMGSFIEDFNKFSSLIPPLVNNLNTCTVEYVRKGMKWYITHRAFRDDTNDRDVEQVICEMLNQPIKK